MRTKPFNAHAFKLLLQTLKSKFPNLDFRTENGAIELASQITFIDRGKVTYDDTEFSISIKTLRRYLGFQCYGSEERRYTPEFICLDLLSRVCGFKNWDQFQNESEFKMVTNILPYEQKQDYWNKGIWYADSANIGDVMYFGNEYKYVAFQKKKFGLELFDFKNIPCFSTFTWHEIEGVEVIGNENQEISIRLIY